MERLQKIIAMKGYCSRRMAEELIKKGKVKVNGNVITTMGYKANINDFIDIIQMWYRDVLLFKVTKDPNNLIFRDEINFIRKSASQSSYEGIETILNSCEIAKARIKANVNFDLAMELMLLNIKEN